MSIRPQRSPARRFVLGMPVAAVAALVAACLDTTPVEVAPSGGLVDGGLAAEASTSPCVACLGTPDKPGPGCGTELAACEALPACSKTYACVRDQGCFNLGSASAIENCGIPCAQKEGILATGGTAEFNAAYAVFACAASGCGRACVGADAGH